MEIHAVSIFELPCGLRFPRWPKYQKAPGQVILSREMEACFHHLKLLVGPPEWALW